MKLKGFVFVVLLATVPSLSAAQQGKLFTFPLSAGNRITTQEASVPLSPELRPSMVPSRGAGETSNVSLTLAELEAMAEKCHPTLAQAAARVQAARGQYLQAGLYPNPVIGYQGSEIGNEGRAGQQGGFVGLEIITAGKLQLNRAVASQEIRQAEYFWQAQRFRVLTDVRRAFYEVIIAQHTVELAQQLLTVSEQGVKAAEDLLQAKEVSRVDVLQAKIENDSAKILLEKARNRYTAAWRNLVAVVGNPALPPTPLEGDLLDGIPRLTWEETLNRVLAESPELAAAQTGVARARAALSRECAGRFPNVDLQASIQHDNATGDTTAGVQVGVPIPIFNRNQGNIAKAQADLVAAQQEVRRVRLALEQRLAAVFEQYATSYQQVEKYRRDILPNAEESLKLVIAGYQQGEFSYLALLTSQRTYFQTYLAYLEAVRELRAATAGLEGYLLSDSLQRGDAVVVNAGDNQS